jgi:hypothetical protein
VNGLIIILYNQNLRTINLTQTSPSNPEIRKGIIAFVVILLLCPFPALSYFPFLVFLVLLTGSCIIGYVILLFEKNRSFKPLVDAQFPVNASVFQIALLLHGKQRAIQTAIVDLVRRKLIEITIDGLFQVYKERYLKPAQEQNPLVAALLNEEKTCVTYDWICYVWYNKNMLEHPGLLQIRSLANHKESFFKKVNVLAIPFVTGITGVLRFISNDKPVEAPGWYMLLLTAITAVLLIFVNRGSLIIKRAKDMINRQREVSVFHGDYIVSGFALEGSEAIEHFSDGLMLIKIFNLGPVIDKISGQVMESLNENDDDPEWEYVTYNSDGDREIRHRSFRQLPPY